MHNISNIIATNTSKCHYSCTIYFGLPTYKFLQRCLCFSWPAWPWLCPTSPRAARGSTDNTIPSTTTATDPVEENPPFIMCVPLPELELPVHMLMPMHMHMHMLLDLTILDTTRGQQVKKVHYEKCSICQKVWIYPIWCDYQIICFKNQPSDVCNICQTVKSRMRMSRISLQAFLRGQAPPADKGGREGVP